MPIASTTTDYTGRQVDISILQYPDALKLGAQDVAITLGDYGRYCAGVQKLIQRYAILLLTDVGSREDFPTDGTAFLPKIKNGSCVVDKLAASQLFAISSYAVVNLLKTYQSNNPTIPADEQIASAKLQNVSMYGGAIGFDVLIKTEAGDSIDFVIPLPN